MILVFAVPRTASTMFQKILSEICQSEKAWEPLTAIPQKIDDYKNARFVVKWFRAAPAVRSLPMYKIDNYYLGCIPEDKFDSEELKPYRQALKNYLEDMHRNYGSDAVIKFVRLLGNTKFVYSIIKELDIKSKFIYVKRNPLEIAYSYYRKGGFNKRSSWRVNQVFMYRKAMYAGQDRELDLLFSLAKTPLDKITSSIIADYKALDDSVSWLKKRGVDITVVNYEDFVRQPENELNRCLSFLNIPDIKYRIQNVVKSHKFDTSKIDSSKGDPLFSSFVSKMPEDLRNLAIEYPAVENTTRKRVKIKHIRFFLRNLLGSFRDNFLWWRAETGERHSLKSIKRK